MGGKAKRRLSADIGPSRHILGLDGLRAIAFLMVFVSHKVPSRLTEAAGSAGVWMFFVLSGFLISRILVKERETIRLGRNRPSRCLTRFYLNRAARIMPVYLTFLLVLTLLARHDLVDLKEPHRQLANWIFLSNVYIERHGWCGDLGHLWSLAIELQYYVMIGLLALVALRLSLARLAWLALAGSIVFHCGLWAFGASPIHFDVNLLLNLGLFAAGTLAGSFAHSPLPRPLRGDAAMAMVLVVYVVLPFVVARSGFWLEIGRATGLLAALLIVQIAQGQESLFVRFLETPSIRWIGTVSFGAYLFHPVLSADSLLGFGGALTGHSIAETILLDLCLALALAGMSWHFYEAPIQVWCRRRWADRLPERAMSPPS